MNEIRCPNCGKVFQVDEAGYAAIAAQVRTEQFEKDVSERVRAAQRELEAHQQAELADEAGRHRLEMAQKDQEITRLQESAKSSELDKQLAVNTAVREKETEIAELRIQIEQEKQNAANRIRSLQEDHQHEVGRLEAEIERYRDFKLKQSTKMMPLTGPCR